MHDYKVSDFVRSKIALLDESTAWSRAMLAKLRRGIGKTPGELPDIWDLTLAGMPDKWQSRNGKPSYAENAAHTALTLYALHRQGKTHSVSCEEDGHSFGSAAARLTLKDEKRTEAIRKRFNAVATANEFTELAYHARSIVQLLKAEDLLMNYPRFAQDLYYFQYPEQASRVRLRWGEDFYRILNITLNINLRKE